MRNNLEGTTINKYRIGRLLGKGGMGSVYQAQDETLNRAVAIKIIHPSLMHESQFQSRFLQEAQTAANLDHPSIIRIYDFNNDDGWLYMVMELVTKGNLVTYMEQCQQKGQWMPLDETLHLIAQVADALGYAHQRGIVHRDIKPDNVLLKELLHPERAGEPTLRAIVTDFGLVKLKEGALLQTEASMLLGTLPYISPEQLEGKKPDGRTDLYSLGIVLYELVTGKLPFDVRNVDEAFQQHRHGTPTPPEDIRAEVPTAVAAIIQKAMAKDPRHRYRDGAEMAAALYQAARSLHTTSASNQGVTHIATLPEAPPPPATPEPPPQKKPATTAPDQLTIVSEGESTRTHPLLKPVLTIGRTAVNDIVLPEGSVSSRHARLEKKENGWQVIDLQSTNGVFIGGVELTPNVPYPWAPGDKLAIGPYTLTWQTAVAPTYQPPPPPPPPLPPQPPPPPPERPVIMAAPPPPRPRESVYASVAELTHLSSIRLEPMSVSLKPGAQTVIQAHMYNESARVDEFTVEVEGLPRDWVRFSETSVRLMPTTETTFRFTIHAPQQDTQAKTYPYRLLLRSQVDKRVEGHAFGNLLVEPAPRFAASINPPRVKNRGNCQLVLQNTGNTDERFTVLAQDGNEAILFDQMAQRVTVPAGREERVNFSLRPAQRPFTGSSKKSHPFQLQVLPAAGEPKTQAGQLEVSPWIHKRILSFLAIMFGVSMVFSMLRVNNLKQFATGQIRVQATQLAENRTSTRAAVTATVVAQVTAVGVEAATATAQATVVWAIADDDGDGLSNQVEKELGTDALKADTDGDGLLDGEEIDHNGVKLLGTDPKVPDTDDDELLDGQEARGNPSPPPNCENARGQYTNPSQADTDGDGEKDCFDPDSKQWPTPTPTPEVNLLTGADNPSFESDAPFFINSVSGAQKIELMVPAGWKLLVDDNYPVRAEEPDLKYVYPEMIPRRMEHLNECNTAVPAPVCALFNRDQVLKVFKGGLPIRFALYKDVTLQPGVYRFKIDFFADTVQFYQDGQKVWGEEGMAEIQLCIERAEYDHQDWQPVEIGQVSSQELIFIVPQHQNVTLYAKFRNNFAINNNGWFLDNFLLQPVGPAEGLTGQLSDVHNCRADMPAAHTN